MKIYSVKFKPLYPVPCGLIVMANNKSQALVLANQKVTHTTVELGDIEEIKIDGKPQVLFYESGDY